MAITRELLKTAIPGITDDQIEAIMKEVGITETAHSEALRESTRLLEAAQTEASGLRDQIKARDDDIEALRKTVGSNEELSRQFADLQQKYNDDTSSLQSQLTAQAREHATERLFSGLKFTSEYAKKGAMAEFEAKQYTFDGKEFKGASEFIDALKNTPGALVEETPATPPADEPKGPQFAGPTHPTPPSEGVKFDFSGLNFVRKPPEK